MITYRDKVLGNESPWEGEIVYKNVYDQGKGKGMGGSYGKKEER